MCAPGSRCVGEKFLLKFNKQHRKLLWPGNQFCSEQQLGVLKNSIPFWCYIEIVWDLKLRSQIETPQDWPHTLQMPTAHSRLFYLCFWLTSYKLGTHHLLLRFNQFSGPQKSGKHIYRFTIKDTSKDTNEHQMEERHWARHGQRAQSFQTLQKPLHV